MRKALLTVFAVLLVAAPAAADSISGVINAIEAGRVTISGTRYAIEDSTEFSDLGGNRLALSEIGPGTPVEFDLDEQGHLVLVRAAVVR